MSELYAVIMCGGKGERFWPKSRRTSPKQFIRLFGDRSLTRQTSDRMLKLCPVERQVFIAPAEYERVMREQVKTRKANLILEPVGRNTAPAIGVAAAYLAARDTDASMVVLPADHLITKHAKLLACVRLAAKLAQQGLLVTFGIPPSRPDTGYGYIKVGDRLTSKGIQAFRVLGFREKPDPRTARRYVKAGSYLWNSGMFVWRVDVIFSAFERYMPEFHSSLLRLRDAVGTKSEKRVLNKVYRDAPSISVDYAIMEKAGNIAAVRATFDWDDVGSWLALARHMKQDKVGNVVRGTCVGKDMRGCIVDADSGLLAVLGCRDLVIVRSGEAVLVAHKDRLDDIKALVKLVGESRHGGGYL
ncbi:MAG: mannose-1-phosphate guanylyltransferase [candidate division WOR-3 bacterium]|nr:MAG: mannose-1-phosphate guanylyltransferase [candidate division WOR-3 bacterium]